MKDWVWLLLIGAGLYFLNKQGSTFGSPEASGLGVGGRPRAGRPKGYEERLETHKARYGEESLPPRGTGLYRQGIL